MAKPIGLIQRKNAYYIRMRVPVDLVDLIGRKEITRTLKTQDYKDACRRVASERVLINAEFDAARAEKKLSKNSNKTKAASKDMLSSMSREQMIALAVGWIKKQDEEHEDVVAAQSLSDGEWHEVLDTLRTDEGMAAYALKENDYCFCLPEAKNTLKEHRITYDQKTLAFKKLSRIFLEVYAGSAKRAVSRHKGELLAPDTYSHTSGLIASVRF